MTGAISPPPNTKVNFMSATAFVRDYKPVDKPLSDATSSHRGKAVGLDRGYILIDQAWGRKPQQKVQGLNEEETAKWKQKRKRK